MERKFISPKQFVEVYVSAPSSKEAARELGISVENLRNRACRLRKQGVRIPMRGRQKITQEQIQELNDFMKAHMGEEP